MDIVRGSQKQTILNSFLNEYNFGKIQYTLNLNEEGILAECSSKEFSTNMEFAFSKWKFTSTKVEEESGKALFIGKGFEGATLLEALTPTTQKARAAFSYSACVSQAIKQNVELPANGAGGVLYGETKNKIRLLFLPQNVFEFAAHNAPQSDYAQMQGVWQDKNFLSQNKSVASNPRALCFTRASLVYAALTGCPPFSAQDAEERQADILDANYLPLKNKINGVSQILSDALSFDLERSSLAAQKKEAGTAELSRNNLQENDNFCLEELAAELGLNTDGSVTPVERKPNLNEKEFQAQAKKLLDKKSARAETSRIVRRNKTVFIIAAIAILAALFLAHNIHKDNLTKPTTISLSARETAELFFSGMHNLDTQRMQYSSKGKAAQKLIDAVSQIYVSSKMRLAYSLSKATLTPEFWLYKPELNEYWQYGITNFMLGESADSLANANNNKTAPTKKEKPTPLNEEEGAKKTLSVSFYRVHSEGAESQIGAEKISGTIELSFEKKRWLLTNFNLAQTAQNYFLQEFEADRTAALEQCAQDAILAAEILRQKYEWIPTQEAMQNARAEDLEMAAKRERGEFY